MIVEPATALRLVGTPRERGLAQAALRPDARAPVRATAQRRLDETSAARETPAVRRYLDRQYDFARAHCAPELAELDGVAEGFGLDARALFDGLHASAFARLAADDGCTAWARVDGGATLVKNRDIRGDLRALQAVMLHVDDARPTDDVLCVGSLGAPGAYSSGMNRAGLAVADTAVDARAYGIGWLRYFLMTRLLATCASIAEALDFVRSVPHTGGGSLVLADRTNAAAVEFHDGEARVEQAATVARTNHFVAAGAPAPSAAATESHSRARLDYLRAALGASPALAPDAAAALMAGHAGEAALCRHATDDRVRTVSSAIFIPGSRELLFSPDYPCLGRWQRYTLAPSGG